MNDCGIENLKLMQEALNWGCIDVAEVRQQIERAKTEKILSQHKYAIYKTSDGFWHTYLYDEKRPYKRRAIKRKTKEKLEGYLVEIYSGKIEEKLETIRDIYPKWLQHVNKINETSATTRRYDCDWNTWLANDPITARPLVLLDFLTMNEWAHEFVKGKNAKGTQLRARQYYNIIAIIKGCLSYAIEKDVIKSNPFERVRVKKKFFLHEKIEMDDSCQVFTDKHMTDVREFAWSEYLKKKDEAALAVILISYTGLRAGEACGLRWKCVKHDMSEIFIISQNRKVETLNSDGTWDKTKWEIQEKTKSDASVRFVYIPKTIRPYLIQHKNTIMHNKDEDCVFLSKKLLPLNPNHLYKRTSRYSKITSGITRGTHKIRKTYLTTLYNGGIHEHTLLKLAGHETNGQSAGQVLHANYLKDKDSLEDVRCKIDNIFNNTTHDLD